MADSRHAEYMISTDKGRLDVEMIHRFLSRSSYWAQGRSLEIVKRSVEGSLCFGVYREGEQVGFARVVSDLATFAWLCDLFVLDAHRGRGLGRQLVQAVVEHPKLRNLRLILLATRDAQDLYERYGGFRTLEKPDRWMIRRATESAAECAR